MKEESHFLDGKRILIFDNEPDVPTTLEDLLGKCNVEQASSFDQAKELPETPYFLLRKGKRSWRQWLHGLSAYYKKIFGSGWITYEEFWGIVLRAKYDP